MTDKRYNSRIDQQIAVWMQRQEALNRAGMPLQRALASLVFISAAQLLARAL